MVFNEKWSTIDSLPSWEEVWDSQVTRVPDDIFQTLLAKYNEGVDKVDINIRARNAHTQKFYKGLRLTDNVL